MAGEKDPYEVLGVSRTATDDEIRSAYRRLARKHHPDVNPGHKESEEKFKEISGAYDVLSSAEKRKNYDEFGADSLRGGFDPEKARAYQQWRSGREATGAPFAGEAADFDLGDIFGDMFRGGGAGSRRRAAPPADMLAVVELALG